MLRKIDPIKHCEVCKTQLYRKVMGGQGMLEGYRRFVNRKYCDQKCMGKAYIRDVWERVENNIERVTESGCWIWVGSLLHDGYARVRIGAKKVLVHRFTYESFCGPIPQGLEIDHLCRVRCCVNPHHLEPVTHLENVLRGRLGSIGGGYEF